MLTAVVTRACLGGAWSVVPRTITEKDT
jgi:hypothetical protein